ncbi:hypothetical protein, partial [Bradyrhizobium pachyrhizi]|uniref:hypothetical protein n=1 Tax=Bradyrhizobium pachyrhizi TaxID=280333 RepID=UPI001AEBE6D3
SVRHREAAAYWIAPSRLRQGFDEAMHPWRAEALAEAASRAMTDENGDTASRSRDMMLGCPSG